MIVSDQTLTETNPCLQWKFQVTGNSSWCVGIVPEEYIDQHDYLHVLGKVGIKSQATLGGVLPSANKLHESIINVKLTLHTLEIIINHDPPIIQSNTLTIPSRLGLCGFSSSRFQLIID